MAGAIFEVKDEFGGNAVSICQLGQAARGENIVVQVSKHEKAVNTALEMTHRHLIGHQGVSQEQYGESE